MLKRIFAFGALLAWCSALLALRLARSNTFLFAFLIWNLFLAAIPFAASLAFEVLDRYRRVRPLQWVSLAIWLLFPMVLFIFPCMFIVILGPAGIRIQEMFLAG